MVVSTAVASREKATTTTTTTAATTTTTTTTTSESQWRLGGSLAIASAIFSALGLAAFLLAWRDGGAGGGGGGAGGGGAGGGGCRRWYRRVPDGGVLVGRDGLSGVARSRRPESSWDRWW
ncbi:unnamed protein product [Lampetra fluviatilis]